MWKHLCTSFRTASVDSQMNVYLTTRPQQSICICCLLPHFSREMPQCKTSWYHSVRQPNVSLEERLLEPSVTTFRQLQTPSSYVEDTNHSMCKVLSPWKQSCHSCLMHQSLQLPEWTGCSLEHLQSYTPPPCECLYKHLRICNSL